MPLFCRLAGHGADLGKIAAECRRDSGEVKPFGPFKNAVPIKIGRRSGGNRGSGSVVDYLGRTLRCAFST